MLACLGEVNVTVDAERPRARALELVTTFAERRQLYDEAIDVEGEEPSGRE